MDSEATRKNQAPPKLIIPFQTSGIIPPGTSSFQKRCHLVSRMIRAASSNSRGWVTRDWWKAKVMFQAIEVKIAKIDAHSKPNSEPGNRLMNAVTVTDRNPRMGTDCRMSRTGMRTFSARCRRAAAVA
jgi:hypothetical protein